MKLKGILLGMFVLLFSAGCYSVPPEIMAVQQMQDESIAAMIEDITLLSNATIQDQSDDWQARITEVLVPQWKSDGKNTEEIAVLIIENMNADRAILDNQEKTWGKLITGLKNQREMNALIKKYLELTDDKAAQAAAILKALNDIISEVTE